MSEHQWVGVLGERGLGNPVRRMEIKHVKGRLDMDGWTD